MSILHFSNKSRILYLLRYLFTQILYLLRVKNITLLPFHAIAVFYFKFICLFIIYFWLHWVFIAVRGLSLVVVSGGYSSLWCMGFSLRWLLLLQSTGSRCTGFSSGSWALEHRLSICGARAQLLHSIQDLPRPGIEPVSPVLAGRFLTTASPGKS